MIGVASNGLHGASRRALLPAALSRIGRAVGASNAGWSLMDQPSRGIKLFDRLIPEDDPETKKQKDLEREILKKKLGRSKIAEMLSVHKDKKFVATANIEPAATAVVFPGGSAVQHLGTKEAGQVFDPSVSFRNHKATLVTIGFQAISQKQLETWLAHAMEKLPAKPVSVTDLGGSVALLNIVFLEGWFFRAFRGFFTKSVREGVPAAVADMSGIVFSASEKEADHFVERLGIHNRVMGHVFLVDSAGRVRWRAHGDPAPGELDGMIGAAEALLKAAGPK